MLGGSEDNSGPDRHGKMPCRDAVHKLQAQALEKLYQVLVLATAFDSQASPADWAALRLRLAGMDHSKMLGRAIDLVANDDHVAAVPFSAVPASAAKRKLTFNMAAISKALASSKKWRKAAAAPLAASCRTATGAGRCSA